MHDSTFKKQTRTYCLPEGDRKRQNGVDGSKFGIIVPGNWQKKYGYVLTTVSAVALGYVRKRIIVTDGIE